MNCIVYPLVYCKLFSNPKPPEWDQNFYVTPLNTLLALVFIWQDDAKKKCVSECLEINSP